MSLAAPSMLRSRSNCTTTVVLARPLVDVTWATPGIWANCRSRGCATDEAMVSALAPGYCALTWMVGKSTLGRGATGRLGYATNPTNRNPTMTRDVPTG